MKTAAGTDYEYLAERICPKGRRLKRGETRDLVVKVLKETVDKEVKVAVDDALNRSSTYTNNYQLLVELSEAAGNFLSWHDGERPIEEHRELFKLLQTAHERWKNYGNQTPETKVVRN